MENCIHLPAGAPTPTFNPARRVPGATVLLSPLLALVIACPAGGQADGTWRTDAFAGSADTSASTDVFVEERYVPDGARLDIIGLGNPSSDYVHDSPEFVLGARVPQFVPDYLPAPLGPGYRASIVDFTRCLTVDYIDINGVLNALCPGRGTVPSNINVGFATATQNQRRVTGQSVRDELVQLGESPYLDTDAFLRSFQQDYNLGRAGPAWLLALAAHGVAQTTIDRNGLADGTAFDYGGNPTSAGVLMSSVIGMPSNRRDIILPGGNGFTWDRDYRDSAVEPGGTK